MKNKPIYITRICMCYSSSYPLSFTIRYLILVALTNIILLHNVHINYLVLAMEDILDGLEVGETYEPKMEFDQPAV